MNLARKLLLRLMGPGKQHQSVLQRGRQLRAVLSQDLCDHSSFIGAFRSTAGGRGKGHQGDVALGNGGTKGSCLGLGARNVPMLEPLVQMLILSSAFCSARKPQARLLL